MKKQISLQLSDEMIEQLKTVARKRGVGRAIVVEKALAQLFEIEAAEGVSLSDRLSAMDDRLCGMEQALKAVNETVALHARYHLALSSLSDSADTPEPAWSRLDDTAEGSGASPGQMGVERRLSSGLAALADHDSRRDPAFDRAAERVSGEKGSAVSPSAASDLSAAAWEGGSKPGFRNDRWVPLA